MHTSDPISRSRNLSPFTKISRFSRLWAICAVLAFIVTLAAPVCAVAGVVVRVTEDSGSGVAFARQRALESAISAAVAAIVNRHTLPEERLLYSGKLKSATASPASFARRYAIISETVEGSAVTIKADVDLDREAILGSLEKAGFKVFRFDFKPRMFFSVSPDPDSRTLGYELGRLFKYEGMEAAIADAPAEGDPQPEDYALSLKKRGYHAGVKLKMAEPQPESGESGQDFVGPSGSAMAQGNAENADGEIFSAAFLCSYELIDVNGPALVGRQEMVVSGTGADREAASLDAASKAAEDMMSLMIFDLAKAGLGAGRSDARLLITVNGIGSPGSVAELTALMESMAEFRDVKLTRLEYGRAVWTVRAVDSGGDWLGVLMRLQPSGSGITWTRVKEPQPSPGMLAFEGRIVAR